MLALALMSTALLTPIEVTVRPGDDGVTSVTASVVIDAPATMIWSVMTDCKAALKTVPHLKECVITEQSADGRSDVRRHGIRYGGILPYTVNEFRSYYIFPSTITFERTGGDLKVMEGEWSLQALPGGETVVTYRVHLGLGVPVPRILIARAIKRDTRLILERLKVMAEHPEGVV